MGDNCNGQHKYWLALSSTAWRVDVEVVVNVVVKVDVGVVVGVAMVMGK